MIDFRMRRVSSECVDLVVKCGIPTTTIECGFLDKQELMMLKIDLMSAIADIDDYLDKM